MNKEKISINLLNNVSILENNKSKIFVSSENFFETKKFLTENKFNFRSYYFAKCFYVEADIEDINILSSLDHVSFISPKTETTALGQIDVMNIDNLSEGKFLGQNQTICFIDTGIDCKFDFIFPSSRIVKFVDLINHKSTPYDDNGHGTFVCGIACGNGIFDKKYIGIAPKANIIVIKALGKNGSSDSNVILDAMQWVYENHKAYNIGIVCMSFGANTDDKIEPLTQGAEALWKRGIIVVAAAGNSGPNESTIKSPGNSPHIITVGALDTSSMSTPNFSSRGPTIYGYKPDLIAPAVNIISCSNIIPPYVSMSGTSVAAPIVAAVCAIIKSKYPNLTNNQVKNFLCEHCTPIINDKNIEGYGFLNFNEL